MKQRPLTEEQMKYREKILARASLPPANIHHPVKKGRRPAESPFEQMALRPTLEKYSSAHICEVVQEMKRRFWQVIPQDFAWHFQVDDMARFVVRYRWKRACEGTPLRTVEDTDFTVVLELLKLVDWVGERKPHEPQNAVTANVVVALPPFERARKELMHRKVRRITAGSTL